MWRFLIGICALLMLAAAVSAQQSPRQNAWKFDFSGNHSVPGSIHVSPPAIYGSNTGYGFEPGSNVAAEASCCTSNKPFYFSMSLPEGNYRVSVTLGGATEESHTTVKSELRRLMLENIYTAPGKFARRTFCVNIRTPKISTGGQVHLKDREKATEMWDWDDKLTLEFNGQHPSIAAIDVAPASDLPTLYILGDSTVCDQPTEPWNSWGQMLPRFFKPEIVVANNAESGESLRSSLSAHRLDKVLSTMKPRDYLFIQYGHNDMKERGPGIGAFTTYKSDLEYFVAQTRKHGGTPVLITSMERKAGATRPTLGDYPAAVRQVAAELHVALIDLNAMSKILYHALGPNLSKAFVDGTHHNNYGSYELAQCIIEGIRQNHLPIADLIADDVPHFDPAHPDSLADFDVPSSPINNNAKPLGN